MARPLDLHAEIPLLVYLTCITAVLSLFAYTIYWLVQPTVLPNPGLAAYKPLVPTFVLQERVEIPEMERKAIAAAEEANVEQGIAPLRAFAAGAQSAASRTPVAHATISPAPKQAKQKRVVRVQRQQVAQDSWQSWGFAQRSYGGWDGFQSGVRSRWAGGRSSF
jgi:hypothetical protein